MTQTVISKTSLYNSDFLAWVDETTAKLRARDFDTLDIENLIEEIDSLGASQRKELLSRLTVLLEHLIKRIYINMPQEFNCWVRSIRNQRTEIEILIAQSLSLKSRWDQSFDDAWRLASKRVGKDYPSYQIPNTWQFNRDLETLLDVDFWDI